MGKENSPINKIMESAPVKKAFKSTRLQIARRGASLYSFEDQEEHIEEFASLLNDRFPIIYLNHQSHIDVGPMMEATDRLNRLLEKPLYYNFPVAASTKEQQGEKIGNYYAAFAPWIGKHNINIIEVVRSKDRKEYSMEKTEEAYDELDKTVFTDKGLVIFPEGTTTGGKINEKLGTRNGIVKIPNRRLPNMTRASINEAGREVAFLPVGVDGGYNIFDTRRNRIPLKAFVNIALNEVPFVKKHLATAVVGSPFTSTDMLNLGVDIEDDTEVNTFLMKKVARLIPEEARGYYK